MFAATWHYGSVLQNLRCPTAFILAIFFLALLVQSVSVFADIIPSLIFGFCGND
jgi:hypothetical protein